MPIFRKIPKFRKILRSNFNARIDTGTSRIFRTSREIPINPINPYKSQYYSWNYCFSVNFWYFCTTFHFCAKIPRYRYISLPYAVWTPKSVTVARSWCTVVQFALFLHTFTYTNATNDAFSASFWYFEKAQRPNMIPKIVLTQSLYKAYRMYTYIVFLPSKNCRKKW